MKINLVGPLFESSGYASHVRGLANALHDQGVEVRIECPKPQGWESLVNDAELIMLGRDVDYEATNIAIGMPPYWRLNLGDGYSKFVGFLIWEGDKIPQYWIEYLADERVDQIWTPSKHVADAIANTTDDDLILNKVKVVPHGVDLSLFKAQEHQTPKRPFTFCVNKGWSQGAKDRGGVQYILKAYDEEFTKEDNVRLVVKINPSYLSPMWNIQHEMQKLGIGKEGPEILFNSDNMTFESIPKFYENTDVYVCATRAEAFNLTGLEAHAMGLPTIQTGFGGQVDYMKDYDYIIDYELEEVKEDIMYEGIKWAVPNIETLKKTMRECYNQGFDIHVRRNEILKDVKEWTWTKSAKIAIECLKQLK